MRAEYGIDAASRVMRPKLSWRVLLPVLFVLGTLSVVAWGGFFRWSGTAVLGALTVSAYRGYVRIEDGVLYRRGTLRWYPPFRLESLATVALHREWDFRLPFPHLVLSLKSMDGPFMELSLRWWSDSDELVRIIRPTCQRLATATGMAAGPLSSTRRRNSDLLLTASD